MHLYEHPFFWSLALSFAFGVLSGYITVLIVQLPSRLLVRMLPEE